MSWIVLETERGNHVMPNDEQHSVVRCKCRPEYDDDARAWVHNSFDGREDFESGKRKPS
jgi:hypothetical protein